MTPAILAMVLGLPAPIGDDPAPRVVRAWPSGPLDVVVAFDGPVPSSWTELMAGRSITIEGVDDRQPARSVAIAGAKLDDDGRTLRLATGPHPGAAVYEVPLPSGNVSYDLRGVEASWHPTGDAGEGSPAWTGWMPSFNPADAAELFKSSAPHQQLATLLQSGGRLKLRALINVPEGSAMLQVGAPEGTSAELDFEPLDFVTAADRPATVADHPFESFGPPIEFVLELDGHQAIAAEVELRVGLVDEALKQVTRVDLTLPWTPAVQATLDAPPSLPDTLRGDGDASRGADLFFGERAKCSACHQIDGRGQAIGPDLSKVATKYDVATLFREIENPSATIAPEYLPFSLATTDGQVFSGLVRVDGPDALLVTGADGKAARVLRADLAEIRPTATSIMPVGLTGVIGPSGLRDLLAYLIQRK